MGSLFGNLFQVMTFGESHGEGIGCVVTGCPANIQISEEKIAQFLSRRRPGQSAFTTPRKEDDAPEILSGIYEGKSIGTPIAVLVRNTNKRSQDYTDIAQVFRPSHADLTTQLKYGHRDPRGGGRASARETIGRVAAASIAQQVMQSRFPDLEVVAYVERIKDISAKNVIEESLTLEQVEKSPIRCPDESAEEAMKQEILKARKKGDTIGGTVRLIAKNVPAGLGEPVFDKLEAELAKAMLSLPAAKGFEIGSGFEGTHLTGQQHNDPIRMIDGKPLTTTNFSGGVQGGISNGMPITLRVGFKPVATVFKDQETVNENWENVDFKPKQGRHDACVLPRAVPMVEAMAWLVLCDLFLRQQATLIGQNQWPKF